MPRSGAITLSDVPKSTLAFASDKCGREGRYSVARLFAKHGDVGLPDLTAAISADCPRRASRDFYDRCGAKIVTGGLDCAGEAAPLMTSERGTHII